MNKSILTAGLLLALFAIIGVGTVAVIQTNTAEQIAENERQATLRSINELIDSKRYDNDIFHDLTQIHNPHLLGVDEPLTAYLARKEGAPVAAILTVVAPNGYSGRIKLLIGINYDSTISGVRVVTHNETPGLGDGIEIKKSSWIKNFNGKSLNQPTPAQWFVKKDGGEFDQFTGATITPRAIVKAVRGALSYFRDHRSDLFLQKEADK